jgi:hypothetical protein
MMTPKEKEKLHKLVLAFVHSVKTLIDWYNAPSPQANNATGKTRRAKKPIRKRSHLARRQVD